VRAILDTNVLVSGIFFGGLPRRVLESWAAGHFELILSPDIFDEYVRTCGRLAESHPGLEYDSVLASIVGHGTLVPDGTLGDAITVDPDDDKFMVCAQSSGSVVVSGDAHLLDASGWQGVRVVKPRDFLALLEVSDASAE